MRLAQNQTLQERVYLRLLTQTQEEEVLRKYIRESISTGELVHYSPTLGLMTEWDLARAYSKGNKLLTESQSARGRVIVEGLFQGVASAIAWTGQKIGSGVKAVIKAGGETLDAAGKCLMQLLEKIPGGKEAFEFLKDFTK